jgi:large subunit ribosomal protein L21
MYAIIQLTGRQYRVSPDDILKVGRLETAPGNDLVVSDVVMFADGDHRVFGTPRAPCQVKLEVLEHGRGKKMITARFVHRGGVRRKNGYRELYSLVRVKSIEQEG